MDKTIRFSLNILTFPENSEGTLFRSQCPQMPDFETFGATAEESVKMFVDQLTVRCLDDRNAMVQKYSQWVTPFTVTSFPCEMVVENYLSADSDNADDIQRKIDILTLYQRSGYPTVADALSKPCEIRFLESIRNADLDKEKLHLENKLRDVK